MKKILILVAAVMVFGLGTATKADACNTPFTDTTGWTCLSSQISCGSLATVGNSKYVSLTVSNYSCDTPAYFNSLQHSVMGNAGASLTTGGTAGGDFRMWGPFKRGLGAITVPVADCISFTPGTYTVGLTVINPVPAELQGTWAEIMVEAIDSGGQWVDGAGGDCTVFVQ